MSVLDPRELEASPLADLHTLAGELGIEGYRRLRKEDLIKQILSAQGVSPSTDDVSKAEEPEPAKKPRRSRRRTKAADENGADEAEAASEPAAGEAADEADEEPVAKKRPARRSSSRKPAVEVREDEDEDDDERSEPEDEDEDLDEPDMDDVRTGILDVLPNGSGFIRAEPYRQSREDIYVSPAQIRRCELRPGDEVAGPVRPPRRNERHPSLVHVSQVNGEDAETPLGRARFESLTASWPTKRLAGPNALVDSPYGRGSRVAIGGPPGAGATSLLREAVRTLRERHDEVEVIVVLAGARPEEIVEWREIGVPVAGGSFESSPEEQGQVAELAVQRAKRAAEHGRDAVVVIDSLDALAPATARRVFGAGRNAEEGGSVTILAATGVAAEPHRMATTHVTLDANQGGEPRVASSGTLRRDLLS
jgi:transcription termination factor Rho